MKVLGFDFTVDMTHTRVDIGAMGRCNIDELRLMIASDIPKHQQDSTVLHEVIEAVCAALEITVKHEVIAQMEAGLFAVFSSNGVDLSPLLK